MPLNLFIIGPSGCGKSTQAKKIAQKYNLTHLSTGKLFRSEIAQKTKLGLKAQKYVIKGIWVPNDIVVSFLADNLSKIKNENFIVDGTPRKPGQCQLIEKYLQKNNQNISALIYLDISDKELKTRRQNMAKLGRKFQKRRNDTTPEAIARRKREHQKTIKPILSYFKKKKKTNFYQRQSSYRSYFFRYLQKNRFINPKKVLNNSLSF